MQKVTLLFRQRIKVLLPLVAEDRVVLIWCLVGATVAWLFNRLSNDVVVSQPILVEYRLQKGLAQNSLCPSTLSVSVKASGWVHLISSVFSKPSTLTLNADSIGHWVYSKETLLYKVQPYVCSTCKVMEIQPSEINFNVETEIERTLPLSIAVVRHFEKGFFATGDITLVPGHVRVKGPASKLNLLAYWQLDTFTMVSGNSTILPILLQPPIRKGTLLLLDTASIRLEAPAELFTQKKVVVDVQPINMLGQIKFFPRRVTVSFTVALSNYKNTTASDFVIEADFGDILANTTQQTLQLRVGKKPDFVRNVTCVPDDVSFVFVP